MTVLMGNSVYIIEKLNSAMNRRKNRKQVEWTGVVVGRNKSRIAKMIPFSCDFYKPFILSLSEQSRFDAPRREGGERAGTCDEMPHKFLCLNESVG